jgi:hypothetical protein
MEPGIGCDHPRGIMRTFARSERLGGSRMRSAHLVIFLLLGTCVSRVGACVSHAHADEFEQHHAHEHGKVTLNVAIDASTFVVELDAPAVNVVGFEHAPRTREERAAAQQASQFIQAGRGLLGLPPAAGCRFSRTEFTEPHWEPSAAAGADEHSKESGSEEHADYEARFTYHCEHPEALSWFEPWLLAKLLNVTEARINLITPNGQRSESATDSRKRISLQ